jgi:hypothetical protein
MRGILRRQTLGRQTQPNLRAATDLAVDLDVAAVAGNDAFHHSQS